MLNSVGKNIGIHCVSDQKFPYASHNDVTEKGIHFAEILHHLSEYFQHQTDSEIPCVHLSFASRVVLYRFSDLLSSIQGLQILVSIRDPIRDSFAQTRNYQSSISVEKEKHLHGHNVLATSSLENSFTSTFFHIFNEKCIVFKTLSLVTRSAPIEFIDDIFQIRSERLDNVTSQLSVMKEILSFLLHVDSDDPRIDVQIESMVSILKSLKSESKEISFVGQEERTLSHKILKDLQKELTIHSNVVEDNVCRSHLADFIQFELDRIS